MDFLLLSYGFPIAQLRLQWRLVHCPRGAATRGFFRHGEATSSCSAMLSPSQGNASSMLESLVPSLENQMAAGEMKFQLHSILTHQQTVQDLDMVWITDLMPHPSHHENNF